MKCCIYQALATVFQSQPLPPKMLWEVRAVQPGTVAPYALREASRQDSTASTTKSIRG
ncbi:hypothetical protein D3C72_1881260 [compost metagenome]